MALASLNLLVLRVRDVQAAKQFYSLLGISFVQEKHGTGPTHFAAELGTFVFEIYPYRPGQPTVPLRLGFQVPKFDATIASLRERGAKLLNEVQPMANGFRAVVEDPDGNAIELTSIG